MHGNSPAVEEPQSQLVHRLLAEAGTHSLPLIPFGLAQRGFVFKIALLVAGCHSSRHLTPTSQSPLEEMATILSDFIFTNKDGLVRILHPIFLTSYQPEITSKQMVNVGTTSLRNSIRNLPWKYT